MPHEYMTIRQTKSEESTLLLSSPFIRRNRSSCQSRGDDEPDAEDILPVGLTGAVVTGEGVERVAIVGQLDAVGIG